MKVAALVGTILSAASCGHAPAAHTDGALTTNVPDYCAMAVAALSETIKSNREQPYGLEDACVDEMAAQSGKIYVDARFMEALNPRTVPIPNCVRKNYIVRFDPNHFEPSPAAGVVLLLVSELTPQGREFNARMEEPNWPAKQPGTVALSQCGSAFGVLTGSGSHWTARISLPPRGPDDL